MELHEVADVEGVQDAAEAGRVGKVLLVIPSDQSRIERGLDIRAAQTQRLHQVVVHRVLIYVEAGLH